MAMYLYPRSAAALAMSSIDPEPSLQRVCICRSPLIPVVQSGLLARIARASSTVRKFARISGGFGRVGGSSIQLLMMRLSVGPTAGSSDNERPSATISAASSGHMNAFRDARLRAFCSGMRASSAARASNSAIAEFERESSCGALSESVSLYWLRLDLAIRKLFRI